MFFLFPKLYQDRTIEGMRFVRLGEGVYYSGWKWIQVKKVFWVLWKSCGTPLVDNPSMFKEVF